MPQELRYLRLFSRLFFNHCEYTTPDFFCQDFFLIFFIFFIFFSELLEKVAKNAKIAKTKIGPLFYALYRKCPCGTDTFSIFVLCVTLTLTLYWICRSASTVSLSFSFVSAGCFVFCLKMRDFRKNGFCPSIRTAFDFVK